METFIQGGAVTGTFNDTHTPVGPGYPDCVNSLDPLLPSGSVSHQIYQKNSSGGVNNLFTYSGLSGTYGTQTMRSGKMYYCQNDKLIVGYEYLTKSPVGKVVVRQDDLDLGYFARITQCCVEDPIYWSVPVGIGLSMTSHDSYVTKWRHPSGAYDIPITGGGPSLAGLILREDSSESIETYGNLFAKNGNELSSYVILNNVKGNEIGDPGSPGEDISGVSDPGSGHQERECDASYSDLLDLDSIADDISSLLNDSELDDFSCDALKELKESINDIMRILPKLETIAVSQAERIAKLYGEVD